MLHLVLSLGWATAFTILCAIPTAHAASVDWAAAVLLFGIAQAIICMSAKWASAGVGLAVRKALNWRYPLLLLAVTLPLFTLAVLAIVLGTASGAYADPLLVAELSLMQFVAGLACQRAPRNVIVGFRTARTLSSDTEWFAANRRWGWWLTVLAPSSLLGALLPANGPLAALIPLAAVGMAFLFADRTRQR